MSRTISGLYTTTQFLSDPAADNPATVTATGIVRVTDADGIYGAAVYPWSVTNFGAIELFGTRGNGVHLTAGGTVTNGQTGTPGISITAPEVGILIDGAAGTVSNFGRVSGPRSSGVGIRLEFGGSVTNGAVDAGLPLISGAYNGIYVGRGTAAILNFGRIEAPGSLFNGGRAANVAVFLGAGGIVQNGTDGWTTARIDGYHMGVFSGPLGVPVTVNNFGTIAATGTHCNDAAGASGPEAGVGILLGARDPVVRNGSSSTTSALIQGYYRGVGTGYYGSATIVNFGTIESTQTALPVRYFGVAVVMHNGGTITNYGLLRGAQNGVWASPGATVGAPSTIDNFGTIEASAGAAVINGQSLLPSAVTLFNGGTLTNTGSIRSGWNGVVLKNSPGTVVNSGTIESTATASGPGGLASAAVAIDASGGINGANGAFASLTNAAGALITSAGNAVSIGGSGGTGVRVTNSGNITGNIGIVIAASDVGTNTIVNYGTITGAGGIAIELGGGKTEIVIRSGSQLDGAIGDFGADDILSFPDVPFDPSGRAVLNPDNALEITANGSTFAVNLDPSEDFSGLFFHLSSDDSGGISVTEDAVPCFCRGTRIMTERGEVAVESLAIGDKVITLSGASKPIVWIGFGQALVTRANPMARPIVVRSGALAAGVPSRDLYLTHGHGLYFEGVLIPVEHLVNHKSIAWDQKSRLVEFYHIELPDHDVLLADGAPAESYYDANNRASFQNTRGNSKVGSAKSACVPVLHNGEVVETVWARLFERAGGRIDRDTTDDPDVHLVADGTRLDPVVSEDGSYGFLVEMPPRKTLRLCSRAGVPSLLGLGRSDHRLLGIAVKRIDLHHAGITTRFDCDAPQLREGGCHVPENGYCWTDGELDLPERFFTILNGPFVIIVRTEPHYDMRYPVSARLLQVA